MEILKVGLYSRLVTRHGRQVAGGNPESLIALTRSLKVAVITVDETLDPLYRAVKSPWAWVVDPPLATAVASSEMTGFRVWGSR